MTAPAVTTLRASEDHADEALIKLLDYDTIQALKAMQNPEAAAAGADQPGRSIRQAADLLGIPDRTLTRTMLTLNEAYHAVTGQNLIENAGGRVGYRLTEDGADFAVDAGEVMSNMSSLVDDLTVSKGRLNAPTTKACLPMLDQLNITLRSRGAAVWLDPHLHRTSDIHRPRERETAGPYAFYSIGWPQKGSEPYSAYQQLRLDNGAELIILRAEPFRLLAPRGLREEMGLGPGQPVSINRLLRERWKLLVPDGGAVYDFLDYNTPGWARIGRPPKDVLDLQAGLMCLPLSIYQRNHQRRSGGGVMIVHNEKIDYPDHYQLFPIDQGDRPCWALTGLFRDKQQLPSISVAQRRRWNLVWRIATTELWTQPDRPVANWRAS